jgi:hypothetical protein
MGTTDLYREVFALFSGSIVLDYEHGEISSLGCGVDTNCIWSNQSDL